MVSKVERLPIAHGGANSNVCLGLRLDAADTAAIARNWEKRNATARDYGWNPIETAPFDEDVALQVTRRPRPAVYAPMAMSANSGWLDQLVRWPHVRALQ
jgi:hypothetical protein